MTSMETKGTVVVTGANGGLGSAFVERLLQSKPSNQYGIFTVRGLTAQSSGTLEKLLSSSSYPHSIVPLDLTSLSAVREFAEDINSRVTTGKIPQIRAVVLNAAWQTFDGKIHYTKDGTETTFAVDYLSNFLLVLLLLKSMDPEKGRIVFVSSFTHDTSHYMNSAFASEKFIYRDPELIAHPDYEDKKGEEWVQGMRRYALSKMLLIMFMYELQRRLDTDPRLSNISALSMDPGAMPGTGISRDAPLIPRLFMKFMGLILGVVNYLFPSVPFRSPQQSADDLYQACFDEKYLGIRPKAVTLDGNKRNVTSEESRDQNKQEELWEKSVKLAGLKEGDTELAHWK